LFAVFSLLLGKKTGWDLFNYHWYNPFAWLTDRFGFDVAVGHHATYYNPLSDVPLYLIATYGPAWLGGVFSGAMAGVVVSLLGAIAYCVLPIGEQRQRAVAAALLAVLGAFGAGAFQEIGDPANDVPAAIGSFIALLILVSRIETLRRSSVDTTVVGILFAAGLCAGASVGLKLTTAAYGFGIGMAVLSISGSFATRALRLSLFGAGAFAGVLLFGGFWMLRMWQFSGNPFFPYFNDLFHSPLLVTTGYLDPSFHPANWTVRVLFPFFFTANSHYVSESGFRDAHIAAIYVLIPISLMIHFFSRAKQPTPAHSPLLLPQVQLLFVFAGASYVAWLAVFDVYRYLIPLEMISPLLVAMAFVLWPIATRWRIVATLSTLAILQAVVQIDVSDRQSWTGPYVKVNAPTLADPTHTMILMTGHEAMAFVIPSFPRAIPFVRIDGWLVQGSDQSTGLALAMHKRVAAHHGPLYVLYASKERASALTAAKYYGLSLAKDDSDCVLVTSNIADPLSLCPVHGATL